MPRLLAVVCGGTAREREEPRPQRARPVVGVDPPVHGDEHVMDHVLEIPLAHAKAAQAVLFVCNADEGESLRDDRESCAEER